MKLGGASQPGRAARPSIHRTCPRGLRARLLTAMEGCTLSHGHNLRGAHLSRRPLFDFDRLPAPPAFDRAPCRLRLGAAHFSRSEHE